MTSLTLIKNSKGDFGLHVTGCSDIARSATPTYRGEKPPVYEGADLLAALVAVDTDAAGWFCELPYTDSSREQGCWAVAHGIPPAPCLTKLIKAGGIGFEAVTGRPVSAESLRATLHGSTMRTRTP